VSDTIFVSGASEACCGPVQAAASMIAAAQSMKLLMADHPILNDAGTRPVCLAMLARAESDQVGVTGN
jgi:hypothetical protein